MSVSRPPSSARGRVGYQARGGARAGKAARRDLGCDVASARSVASGKAGRTSRHGATIACARRSVPDGKADSDGACPPPGSAIMWERGGFSAFGRSDTVRLDGSNADPVALPSNALPAGSRAQIITMVSESSSADAKAGPRGPRDPSRSRTSRCRASVAASGSGLDLTKTIRRARHCKLAAREGCRGLAGDQPWAGSVSQPRPARQKANDPGRT